MSFFSASWAHLYLLNVKIQLDFISFASSAEIADRWWISQKHGSYLSCSCPNSTLELQNFFLMIKNLKIYVLIWKTKHPVFLQRGLSDWCWTPQPFWSLYKWLLSWHPHVRIDFHQRQLWFLNTPSLAQRWACSLWRPSWTKKERNLWLNAAFVLSSA